MPTMTFNPGTVIPSTWLNDVNSFVFGTANITTAKLIDGSVTTAKFDSNAKSPFAGAAETAINATNAVNATNATNIADGAVSTTAKIVDSVVTPAKLTQPFSRGTAQATTSGSSITFAGIPSWARRISIVFSGVSLTGSSNLLVQVGVGVTPTTTGYLSTGNDFNSAGGTFGSSSTSGFLVFSGTNTNIFSGTMVLLNISGNTWISSHIGKINNTNTNVGAGDVTLGGTLGCVTITNTASDTFDAGSINVFWE